MLHFLVLLKDNYISSEKVSETPERGYIRNERSSQNFISDVLNKLIKRLLKR